MQNPKYPFMNIERVKHIYRPTQERIRDFREVEGKINESEIRRQATRCMNCGIPFCHGKGCPLGNLIPDMNNAVAKGDDRLAWEILSSTSPFPEFTSRICPALCEGSCTEGLDREAVMVRQIEKHIVETAFAEGWVKPAEPEKRNGRKVFIIGSGPSGLAAAHFLNKEGFEVTVLEKNQHPGGLLRYGIPDFKLSKQIVERRIQLLKEAGIRFICGTTAGTDVSAAYLHQRCDALLIANGTPVPRDLTIPGRELSGIHFALELLQGQNRAVSGERPEPPVHAAGKKVLVIGGGDTGSDCVGTAHRQKASEVTQIEIMPRPPETRSASTPWPEWPYLLRTSSSHEEGCIRRWNLASRRFVGQDGHITGVEVVPVEWELSPLGRPLKFHEIPEGKPEIIEADLVLLAMGFLRRDRAAVLASFGLEDTPSVFLAGDAANGPSLVVRAIVDGMKAAEQIRRFLS